MWVEDGGGRRWLEGEREQKVIFKDQLAPWQTTGDCLLTHKRYQQAQQREVEGLQGVPSLLLLAIIPTCVEERDTRSHTLYITATRGVQIPRM